MCFLKECLRICKLLFLQNRHASLKLKKGARLMITANIDLNDRSINGQFGTVYDFGFTNSSKTKVYLKLDDKNAGKKAMLKDSYALNHQVLPVQMVEANIKISKNSSQRFKRTQFPLTLTWACTVSKVQGLTLSTIVVSFEL